MKAFILILLATYSLTCNAQEQRKYFNFNQIKIGSLLNQEGNSGCGCEIYLPDEQQKTLILAWADDKKASINTNNRTEKIDVRSETESDDKIGSKFTIKLASKDIKVTANFSVTKKCTTLSDSCEGEHFSAEIYLELPNDNAQIKATGYCGC